MFVYGVRILFGSSFDLNGNVKFELNIGVISIINSLKLLPIQILSTFSNH